MNILPWLLVSEIMDNLEIDPTMLEVDNLVNDPDTFSERLSCLSIHQLNVLDPFR